MNEPIAWKVTYEKAVEGYSCPVVKYFSRLRHKDNWLKGLDGCAIRGLVITDLYAGGPVMSDLRDQAEKVWDEYFAQRVCVRELKQARGEIFVTKVPAGVTVESFNRSAILEWKVATIKLDEAVTELLRLYDTAIDAEIRARMEARGDTT